MGSSSPVPSPQRSTNQLSNEEENVQLLAKHMLQSRLFVGNFQEKRYVSSLDSYRDVIVINKEETELIRDLEVVKKRICDFYPSDHWVGITNPDTIGAPSGYCLWAQLSEDVFGSYWYKIRGVKFKDNEVFVKLKILRPVESIAANSSSKLLQISTTFTKENLTDTVTWFFTTVMTLNNTKETFKFLSILLVALFTGCINLVQYLGDFTLKFMRETSNLIRVLTPSVIAFINMCGKIVGGFYLLILSMWRTKSAPVYRSPYIANSYNQRGIEYNTVYYKRDLPPPLKRSTSGVVITPLD